jgi:hypothetical protein
VTGHQPRYRAGDIIGETTEGGGRLVEVLHVGHEAYFVRHLGGLDSFDGIPDMEPLETAWAFEGCEAATYLQERHHAATPTNPPDWEAAATRNGELYSRCENQRDNLREQLANLTAAGEPIRIRYTNYRGETALRNVRPLRIWHGTTKWHPEPQWLMDAIDTDRGVERAFALRDVVFGGHGGEGQ